MNFKVLSKQFYISYKPSDIPLLDKSSTNAQATFNDGSRRNLKTISIFVTREFQLKTTKNI